jgi:hypothetical protein
VQFWRGNEKEGDQKDDGGGKIILKWNLEKDGGVVWTGLIWLKIVASRWLLVRR